MVNPGDKTITFSIQAQNDDEIRQILLKVYEALKQRGYNPIDRSPATSSPKTPRTSPT